MNELELLLEKYQKAESEVTRIEKVSESYKKNKREYADKICEYFSENQLEEINTKYGLVTAKHETCFCITGGKRSTPQRTKMIAFLERSGHADKVHTYKEMDQRHLNRILERIPLKTLQQFIDQKLISLYTEPIVSIKSMRRLIHDNQ